MKLIDEIIVDLHTTETTFIGKLKNVLAGTIFCLVWSAFIIFLYKTFIPEFSGSGYEIYFDYFQSNIYINFYHYV